MHVCSAFPSFLVPPLPTFLINGSSATLDCVADGLPAPNISWKLDGKDLDFSFLNVELHENGSLTITEASLDTDGFFTCVADNGFGINEITVLVEVVFIDADHQNAG